MGITNLISLAGIGVLGLLAWLAGGAQRPLSTRTVGGAGTLMVVLGATVFWLPPARSVLLRLNDLVLGLLDGASAGALFLFGPLAVGPGAATPAGEPSVGFVLAAQVLPMVVFFASLMALLFHLGLVQPLVRLFGRIFRRALGLSGAEALAGASYIFFGVESATTVRPYLARMTRSELLTMLTCGMSTVASTTLAIYVLFLRDAFPQIAGHLISASVISIPAAVLVSKLMLPETEEPETAGVLPPLDDERQSDNAIGALAAGSWDGLRLAAGISGLLIAVLGLVGVVDLLLVALSSPFSDSLGGPLSLGRMLGWLFTPVAWLLGIESADLQHAGRLLGMRIITTEVPAYQELGRLAQAGELSDRSLVILSYALCGFTHVASVGVFVGGISALAPARRNDLAALGPRALLAATIATLMTGALAGAFHLGQRGLLGL